MCFSAFYDAFLRCHAFFFSLMKSCDFILKWGLIISNICFQFFKRFVFRIFNGLSLKLGTALLWDAWMPEKQSCWNKYLTGLVPIQSNSLHTWFAVDHQPSLSAMKLWALEEEVLQKDTKGYRKEILLKGKMNQIIKDEERKSARRYELNQKI